ncbi:efflux RND transporter periplasmic adaptor subunit [Sphingomonas sp. LHG3406-1]|uniref:efflux RND transporter periplasmic adaptor subunit n=1 Tax=Sphingomonas sp. LHG3406-1 TaxID=2804617 RepID=UPI00262B4C27|nr:efflux RND transporter periplasmic adaptor subunit [Sphingomonas sp. LHG3406-1]
MIDCKGAMRRLAAPVVGAAALLLATPVAAHEGEDHGTPPAASAPVPEAATGAAAGEAHSDRYEVVVQAGEEPRVTIFLDDYATNTPVTGARVSVVIGEQTVAARATAPGTFEARLSGPLAHGTTNVDVVVQGAGGDDLLSVPVVVPEHDDASEAGGFAWRTWLMGASIVGLIAALGWAAFRLRRRNPVLVAMAATVVTFAALTPGVQAHGDEPHGDEPADPAAGDAIAGNRPVRSADGSLLVPKPSQRLLGIRTVIGTVGTGTAASRLQAQVIPDPARLARLATARGGRVLAGGAGFPRPGQAVSAGQVLFRLQPALSASEAASSAAEVRSLEREVRLAEQELRRLEQLRGIVARAEIERARTNLAGLRSQRSAAAGPVQSVEAVRAPISGTVSAISTAIGAVAEPGSQLAEIVGNGGWLVEARGLAAGQRLAGASAVGVTADGRRFGLRLVGRSPQLVDGSDRFLFTVANGAGSLRGGEAVTVEATLVGASVQRGVVLPADAISRGEDGQLVAWVKPSAMRFVPRQVRTQPLPGGRVLVVAGLQPGDRVVTQAAGLLGQIR